MLASNECVSFDYYLKNGENLCSQYVFDSYDFKKYLELWF